MICAPWLVRAAKTCSGLQRLFDTAVPTSGACHAALNRLPLVVVRKRPTLTSFHPTPPGSPSLLQVSINSEEVQSAIAGHASCSSRASGTITFSDSCLCITSHFASAYRVAYPVAGRDTDRSPGVTHESSVSCRQQTPWYDG